MQFQMNSSFYANGKNPFINNSPFLQAQQQEKAEEQNTITFNVGAFEFKAKAAGNGKISLKINDLNPREIDFNEREVRGALQYLELSDTQKQGIYDYLLTRGLKANAAEPKKELPLSEDKTKLGAMGPEFFASLQNFK